MQNEDTVVTKVVFFGYKLHLTSTTTPAVAGDLVVPLTVDVILQMYMITKCMFL
jgi:hypothetical protein